MADSAKFSFLLFFVLSLLVHITVSADPPHVSPGPSPHSGAGSPSPASTAPASAPTARAPDHAPASSPLASSPPAPPPDNSSHGSSPSPSPSPAPADRSAVSHDGVGDAAEKADNSSGGLSTAKKAGIAAGVILVAFVIGVAGVIYKKRQQNIQRSQYGYAARRELL